MGDYFPHRQNVTKADQKLAAHEDQARCKEIGSAASLAAPVAAAGLPDEEGSRPGGGVLRRRGGLRVRRSRHHQIHC